jgi:hypothetical protein
VLSRRASAIELGTQYNIRPEIIVLGSGEWSKSTIETMSSNYIVKRYTIEESSATSMR